ncbi:MAG: LysM peptidoglycan-binding domain-containing protein [Chloroflexi bacterium]|nr:LysM peptidoglycan-binding domain-containing protein [Chloroflexota bacterium]
MQNSQSQDVTKYNLVLLVLVIMAAGVVTTLLWLLNSGAPSQASLPVPTLAAQAVLPAASATPVPTPTIPATAVPTPEPAPAATYTVQAGNTLFSIAQSYGLTVEELAAANGIADVNSLTVGQVLQIPGAGGVVAEDTAVAPPTDQPSQPPINPPPPQIEAAPDNLGGIPLSSIIVMPDNVVQNARRIFAQGQVIGRNPNAYSKIGDSTIQSPYFMARFDEPGGYNMGRYAYLQPTIDYFAGSHGREGAAVRKGFHSWTVTDPMWADKTICQPAESPVACEFRLHNPAIVLIRLGSNDRGVPAGFEKNVRQIIEFSIANGVIPVIGTKADRFEGSNQNNDILRRLAAEYELPVWDFDVAAQIIPGRGLDVDNVHLTTFYAHDYSSPVALQRGHGVHNLTALMMLDAILNEVILPELEIGD